MAEVDAEGPASFVAWSGLHVPPPWEYNRVTAPKGVRGRRVMRLSRGH